MPASPVLADKIQDYAFDVETYRNVFTCVIKRICTGERWIFEISDRRNQSAELVAFLTNLKNTGCRLVGFNNIGFDYPILHLLIELVRSQGYALAFQLWNRKNEIFAARAQNNIFAFSIPEWKWLVPQLDLFKIHHFDNKAKGTSLKSLEFNMRDDTIADLPFDPDVDLAPENIDELIRYNCTDVNATIRFYRHTLPMIYFREELSTKYGHDFTNHNDTKIGKDFFAMQLEQRVPGICFEKVGGRKVPRQTFRRSIALASIIFPYVAFQTPEFQRVLDFLKATTITNTNSPPELENLHAIVGGFQFDFGTGGIHGSVSNQVVRADADNELIDIDVKSYYPNLAIRNRVYPEHLSAVFCDIYEDLYNQRASYPKKSAASEMLKLALNGVYGDSNNPHSPFLDPAYTMTITVNGQLLLCMLAEMMLSVPGISIVQINTDGMTLKVHKTARPAFDWYYDQWQKMTALTLESVNYASMFIRDVNNYVAVDLNGKIKRKGVYQFDTTEPNNVGVSRTWSQDWSALVIPKAACAAMIDGTPVAEFINTHPDPYDFMIKGKAPRTSKLVLSDGRELQNTIRYHIATDGPYLFKMMPALAKQKAAGKTDDRKIAVDKGWSVNICNDVTDYDWSRLNRAYYISEAEKLIGMLQ